jgi:transposase
MPSASEVSKRPKYIGLNRNQMMWLATDLEQLIPADHTARAIWALIGRLDLKAFEEEIKSVEGEGGRPLWPPGLLISVLLYAYSQGVSAVRQMERMMEEEPGMRWLCAGQVINYHTLADFRMGQKSRLEGLFTGVLAVLEQEGLIDLSTVMQDGTKVRAVAGKESFHRRKTLEEHRERAREALWQLEEQSPNEPEAERRTVAEAARQRAVREKVERMQAALQELEQREAAAKPGHASELRVSESEPEARKMKQSDGGWAPSYNVQTSTDAKQKILLAVSVTQEANDVEQLQPAIQQIEIHTGSKPKRVITDGGYTSRENVSAMASQQIEFVAPWPDIAARQAGALQRQGIDREFSSAAFIPVPEQKAVQCPAGKLLPFVKQHQHHAQGCWIYQAAEQDCAHCEQRARCCGQQPVRQIHQVQETAAMKIYLERMQQPETEQCYKQRKAVAETPHLWWKAIFRWRRFSVRGLAKAAKEALWLGITYNVRQWIRLRYRPEIALT